MVFLMLLNGVFDGVGDGVLAGVYLNPVWCVSASLVSVMYLGSSLSSLLFSLLLH